MYIFHMHSNNAYSIILNLACLYFFLWKLERSSYHTIFSIWTLIMVHYYLLSGQRALNICLMCRGIKVSAVAVMALDGLIRVRCSRDSINEVVFCDFLERHLLPHLLPFNGVNPLSVVLLDNASIHHTARPVELIQRVGALVHYLPAYSPDLQPN